MRLIAIGLLVALSACAPCFNCTVELKLSLLPEAAPDQWLPPNPMDGLAGPAAGPASAAPDPRQEP